MKKLNDILVREIFPVYIIIYIHVYILIMGVDTCRSNDITTKHYLISFSGSTIFSLERWTFLSYITSM